MDSGSYLLLPGEQSKVQPRKKERSSEEKYIGHAVIKSEFVAGRNEMWNRDLADCTCTLCTRSHSRSHLGGAGQTVNFVEWSAVEWKRRSGALSNCGGGMPDDPPPFQRFHCGGTTFDCGHDKRTIDRSIHPSIDRWSVRHFQPRFGCRGKAKTDTDTDTDTDALLALPINSQSSPQHRA